MTLGVSPRGMQDVASGVVGWLVLVSPCQWEQQARRSSVWGIEERALERGRRDLGRSRGGDCPTVRATSRVGATTSEVRGEGERKRLEGSIYSGWRIYCSSAVSKQGPRWGSPPFRTQVQHWWGVEWRRWRNVGRCASYERCPICQRPFACEETCGVISLHREGKRPNWGKEAHRGVVLPE